MGNALSQSFFIATPPVTEQNCPDQTGKVHIITGAYSGVGQALASILYSKNGTVYIAGRSSEKATAAISTIKKDHPSSDGKLVFLHIDLSDLSTVAPAVTQFEKQESRLDVLHNNAGVMFPPSGSTDAQGHELQMGTNCLGAFLLTKLLAPVLEKTAASDPNADCRVTWAGSIAVDLLSPRPIGMKFDSSTSSTTTADAAAAGDGPSPPKSLGTTMDYAQSKVGNVFLARESSRRYPNANVAHVSYNPGNLWTGLQRHTGFLEAWVLRMICYPARFGAYTELAAAVSKSVKDGDYVVPWGNVGRFRPDIEAEIKKGASGAAGRFWDWCDACTESFDGK